MEIHYKEINMKKSELLTLLKKVRVTKANHIYLAYAFEILEDLGDFEINSAKELEKALLNGAENWKMYSKGGCSLIYDDDIKERLGIKRNFKNVDWLQAQAYQLKIASCFLACLYLDNSH